MDGISKILGNSTAIMDLRSFVRKAATSDLNVLISGETGVGKDLAARAIHDLSPRYRSSFINLNCASLNDNLIESELFGHCKGSFTGALTNKIGLYELSDKGTLFINEIADMNLYIQTKLLSVIEDKEIRRIGDNQFKRVDTRHIFASNKDLSLLVKSKLFRPDLYYRINTLSFCIPPLRKRKTDIPILIEAFLEKASSEKNRKYSIDKEAIDYLLNYYFPGNIRELQNILRKAIEFCKGTTIRIPDIRVDEYQNGDVVRIKRRKEISIKSLVDAFVMCNGNKSNVAKMLKISRVHLYELLKKNSLS